MPCPPDAPESLVAALRDGKPICKAGDIRFVVDAVFDVANDEQPSAWLTDALTHCDDDRLGVALIRKTKATWRRFARGVATRVAAAPQLPKTEAAATKYWTKKSLKRHGYLDFVQRLPNDLLASLSRRADVATMLARTLHEAWAELRAVEADYANWPDRRHYNTKIRMTARWLGQGGSDIGTHALATLLRSTRATCIDHFDVHVWGARTEVLHGLALTNRTEAEPTLVCELLTYRTDSSFEGLGPRQAIWALPVDSNTLPVFRWLSVAGWLVEDMIRPLAASEDPRAMTLLVDIAQRTRKPTAIEAAASAPEPPAVGPVPDYELLSDTSWEVRHHALRELASSEPRRRRSDRVTAPDFHTHRLALASAELLDIELQRLRRPDTHRDRRIAMPDFWEAHPRPDGIEPFRLADVGAYGPHTPWCQLLRHIVDHADEAERDRLSDQLRRVLDEGAAAVAADILSALPACPEITPFDVREALVLEQLGAPQD